MSRWSVVKFGALPDRLTVVALDIDHPRIARFDAVVDDQFAKIREHPAANRLFYAASEAANHSLLWHALTWVGVFTGARKPIDAVRTTVALGVESALVNGPIKMAFRRARPEVVDVRPHALRVPLTSSFPSGHATSGFCAAVLLSKKKTLPFYLSLATVVASSRVHVRIHHASDVVAGAALGTALGLAFRRMLLRK
jgi:membrane-associated phospholipid phosphatase